jgi:hypothetical protein
MNIVMFGVTEDGMVNVRLQKVDQALCFVTGQTVDVADAFRIGRFDAEFFFISR